ncbi:diphosphomevalonate decarboxylase [Lacticaseibacillus brantae]|uniref:diphosphomevalonate decarboxylase n=1 Tax=Lacticaseibacillus brantae DSM 23927 TaxID=1423727 RepID=A0A0R2B8H5_9LACO|nr:diphosphomevalonate decarboxylase [Lacticaseibacillus brantae]KRM72681.1 Diphosphomevalonate decarboxylase [Lacticaseibacillus brantae DSM 23927]
MTTARAHTNIALIKYWGKKDPDLMLPYTSSLSMTLADYYTETSVHFDASLDADQFYLDGRQTPAAKVSAFLDLVRQQAGRQEFATVTSANHVPTTAGLASSASAYAALALAASTAAGMELSATELSRLARRGSGSASRSIAGGFVIWHRGHDDATSYAEPVATQPTIPIRMVVVLVNGGQKAVSSRAGMQNTVATSPFYSSFVTSNEAAIAPMQTALANNDFTMIGELAEASSYQMHATMLAAKPALSYFEPKTITALQHVQQLRQAGIPAYATMDAGPNVKILTLAPFVDRIVSTLRQDFKTVTVTQPGPAATLID